MKKHLLKEVVNFWWRNQDCLSIAAELWEKFNTRVFLNIYFRIPSPPAYHKNGRFCNTPPFCFFKEKYLLKEVADFKWCDQDCTSIAAELCEEFNKKFLLNIYFRTPFSSSRKKAHFYDMWPFCFLIKKKTRERWSNLSYCKCVFFSLLSAPFLRRKCLFW